MLALWLAISTVCVHAILATRKPAAPSTVTVPVFTVCIAAACAAAARFGVPLPGGVSPAEVIVSPLVFVLFIAATLRMLGSDATPLRIWPIAGLVFLLGAMAAVDRVDALNAQLLLVLALGLLWIGSDGQRSDAPDPDAAGHYPWLVTLSGVLGAAMIGWAILEGVDARIAIGLVSANLLAWAWPQRDLASLAMTAVISIGVGVGSANLVRVIGGAMAQPEWGAGQMPEAIALELVGRPYLPGFGAMLPEVMLLVIGVLLVVLASESNAAAKRRWVTAGMLLGLAGVQIALVWVGSG